MADKYKAIRKQTRKERKVLKMCIGKVQYETKEAAYQKGQDIYKCPLCGMYHRTSMVKKIINLIRKKK